MGKGIEEQKQNDVDDDLNDSQESLEERAKKIGDQFPVFHPLPILFLRFLSGQAKSL